MTEVKLKALIERIRAEWDASVTADLSQISSVQLLFILTTLKPITKVSELRIDMRYSMLGSRCHAAHKRQIDHQSSVWNRIAEPVLGSGVNMTDEGIERIAIECGWRATWMTEAVTTYSRKKQAKAKASPDGRLSFAPAAPAASPPSPTPLPSQGRVPTSEEGRVPPEQPPAALLPANEATVGGYVASRHRVYRDVEGRVPQPLQADATHRVEHDANPVEGRVPHEGNVSVNPVAAGSVQTLGTDSSAPLPPVEPPVESPVEPPMPTTDSAHVIVADTAPFAMAKSKARAMPPRAESQDDQGDDTETIDAEEDEPDDEQADRPENRWNQDICLICHSEMKLDEAGMFQFISTLVKLY